MAIATLPYPLPRDDPACRSALVSILNVLHPRHLVPLVLDAALRSVWWFTIETATVGGTCLRLDLLDRAIRLRGIHVQDAQRRKPFSSTLPFRIDPESFNLGHGYTAEDTIALLEWWSSPDSPTAWVPTLQGLAKSGLELDECWLLTCSLDGWWAHARQIVEWWITTGRLDKQSQDELKCAQWMVIDFGTTKTIQVWRQVYNHLIAGPNIRGPFFLAADVACILTPDDCTAVQYCKDRGFDCVVSERAFLEACAGGNTEALDWYISLGMDLNDFEGGASTAASKGQVCVLEWFDKQRRLPAQRHERRSLFTEAMWEGRVPVLEWLWRRFETSPGDTSSAAVLKPMLQEEIESTKFHSVVEWLVDKFGHVNVNHVNCFRNDTWDGTVTVMEWWMRNAPESMRMTAPEVKASCLRSTHPASNAFQWCIDKGFGDFIDARRQEDRDWLASSLKGADSAFQLDFCKEKLDKVGYFENTLDPHVLNEHSGMKLEQLEWWARSGLAFVIKPGTLKWATVPMLNFAKSLGLLAGTTFSEWQPAMKFNLHHFQRQLDSIVWWIRDSGLSEIPSVTDLESKLATGRLGTDVSSSMCVWLWLQHHGESGAQHACLDTLVVPRWLVERWEQVWVKK